MSISLDFLFLFQCGLAGLVFLHQADIFYMASRMAVITLLLFYLVFFGFIAVIVFFAVK